MDGLAAFLAARLDEEEAAAKAAQAPSPWKAADHESDNWIVTDAAGEPLIYDEGTPSLEEARHIARHDPARTLREVSTWRRLLSEYSIPPGMDAKYGGTERETGFRLALSLALKCKAAEYYGHPDYDPGRWPSVLV